MADLRAALLSAAHRRCSFPEVVGRPCSGRTASPTGRANGAPRRATAPTDHFLAYAPAHVPPRTRYPGSTRAAATNHRRDRTPRRPQNARMALAAAVTIERDRQVGDSRPRWTRKRSEERRVGTECRPEVGAGALCETH